ncbi:hypothetical protein SAMN05421788_10852 [Filimonas lacunae]|uniref:DUF2188 domain-containing protein n=1 Tax=Filimonas lacunae TaxID=477680 RepID=A0A1N7R0A4_9BACT|nr:DUF2188 domain-containing protein [Filimonas lacunae]SIT28551.1 hypothetical protein SAMN05421788_10852 [Filimonas lacunae]
MRQPFDKKSVACKTGNASPKIKGAAASVMRSKVVSKPKNSANNIHYVLPLGNGWVIKSAQSAKFTAITDSRAEAISIGRMMAQTDHSQLVVHGKNGVVQIRESYI